MMADSYHEFQQMLEERGIIVSYCGLISEKMVVGMGEAVRQRIELDSADTNTSKRVFSIFVEQVQNIIRYSADRIGGEQPAHDLSSGLILIGRKPDGQFFVAGGNLIDTEDIERLIGRLEHINSLDKDALKAFYREKLRSAPDPDSKGASIGLIEIARRAAGPILYDVTPVTPDKAFFCLKAFV